MTQKALSWDFNYTLSKSLDDASGLQTSGVFAAAFILNPLRQRDNRAVSDFDVRHILSTSTRYGIFRLAKARCCSGRPIPRLITSSAGGSWPASSVTTAACRSTLRSITTAGRPIGIFAVAASPSRHCRGGDPRRDGGAESVRRPDRRVSEPAAARGGNRGAQFAPLSWLCLARLRTLQISRCLITKTTSWYSAGKSST